MAIGTTGLVVTVAAVAAAAGAGTALVIAETSKAAPPAAPAGDPSRGAALEDQIARQEKEIGELRTRLEEASHARPVVAAAPAAGGAGAIPGGAPTPGSVDSGGHAASPGTTASADAVPSTAALDSLTPADRAKFEIFYREMRQKEQDDQRKARVAAAEAGIRARLDRLPESLGLTAALKDSIVKNLMDRSDRIREAMEEARNAGGPDAMRSAQERTAAVRQESRQALQAILTPEQLRAVDGADRDAGPGGPMRGNGRLGGRPGGNGNGQGGNRPNNPAQGGGGDAGGDPPK